MTRRIPTSPLTKLSTREALGDPLERRLNSRCSRAETLFMQLRMADPASDERRTLRCQSADLSRGGMRIQTTVEVPNGTLIEAWIKIRGEPNNFYLVGEVRWSTANSHGVEVGIALRDAPGTDYKNWRRLDFEFQSMPQVIDSAS